MILHQRFDYSYPTPGDNVYLRIPITSTLWTVIESQNPSTRSPAFPSRILYPDSPISVVFSGVDLCSIEKEPNAKYRILWKIVKDPEDKEPYTFASLPLNKPVSFTFTHGSASLLSIAAGGVSITLNFNCETKVLSTSWFDSPSTTVWSFSIPRHMIGYLGSKISNLLLPYSSEEPTELTCAESLRRLCC